MQALILVMIVSVACFQFLVEGGWLHGLFNYVPELLSVVVAAYVVVRGVESRFRYVRPEYWLIFLALLIGIICGAVVEQTRTRSYVRRPAYLYPGTAVFLPASRYGHHRAADSGTAPRSIGRKPYTAPAGSAAAN